MLRKRKQLCHVISASTASLTPVTSATFPSSVIQKSPKTWGRATASGPADAVLVIRLRAHDI